MIKFTKENIEQFVFLELLSVTPIIIILGNIVPPMPIKMHFIGFGLIFLSSCWILMKQPSKKWILYIAVFYFIIQILFKNFDIKNFIDFFFGPFLLIVMMDLLINNKWPKSLLIKYQKRFYILLWTPLIITLLQHFNILPITFWNATYVNLTLKNGVAVPRPNGFLYHGAELSIIISFVALFQFFKTETKSFWTFFIILFIAFATHFKAVLGCVLILFLFYLGFVNRGALSYFRIVSKERIISYGTLFAILVAIAAYKYFSIVYDYTGYYFPPTMLTGRGSIWNIYLEGIKDFSFWNYLFGKGMGSGGRIFTEYVSADTWYPLRAGYPVKEAHDPHNTLLSIFVNSGITGFFLFFFLFKMVYTQVKNWFPTPLWNKNVLFAVFIIPLFTIGITIPIYEMAIFWVSLGFLFYNWYFYTQEESSHS